MTSPGVRICRLLMPWALIGFILTVRNANAQNFPDREIDPERLAEEIFPIQNLDLNYEELYESMLQTLANPVDLNTASAEDLRSLYVLRERQVESLIAHREEHGPFLSIYELQSVEGFDSITVYRLAAFVKVPDPSSTMNRALLKRMASEKNAYVLVRYDQTLEKKKGYQHETDSSLRYAGSPGRVLIRSRLSRPGDFSFGLVAEKDSGESISWKPGMRNYAMDFYSFHGQLIRKGKIQNLILGDFQAQFGQGLILGGGFGMGKGSESITAIRRSNIGFVPYGSVSESGFFRGSAMSYSLSRNFTLHGFASRYGRDGKLSQDSTVDDSSFISSFAVSGLHRTPGELRSRKEIPETNYGFVLDYKANSVETGLIFHQTVFNSPIVHAPTIYNQFDFQGKENSNVGMFLNYAKNNVAFFSEVARTIHEGAAITAGLLAGLTRELDVSILYRSFARNYISFYSNALSENTVTRNENGIYWGWKYAFNKKYSLTGYIDVFHFPWLRYRAYAPGSGSEWLVRFNYQPSKYVMLFVQARQESKGRNADEESNLYHVENGLKRNYWLNCDVEVSSRLSIKTRVQFNSFSLAGHTTKGMAIMEDLNFELGRVSISGRYALFDTDSYEDRVYAYERDAALAFSFPAYYGTGIRHFLLFQLKVSRHFDLWIRWAHTRFTDRDSSGSAGETINGNVRNDVKLQTRIRL